MWAIWVLLFLIWFVFANIWRFSNYGKVCSGDYLDTKHPKAKNYPNYLIVEGDFIYAVLVTIYVLFGIAIVMILITAMVLVKEPGKTIAKVRMTEKMEAPYNSLIK